MARDDALFVLFGVGGSGVDVGDWEVVGWIGFLWWGSKLRRPERGSARDGMESELNVPRAS